MWIMRTALRYPYTFFVLTIVMVLFSTLALLRAPPDIRPDIKPPVISVVWTYIGMPPADMSNRNAPLGRAVSGGLTFAAVTTLVLVPVVFSRLRRKDVPGAATPPDELRALRGGGPAGS